MNPVCYPNNEYRSCSLRSVIQCLAQEKFGSWPDGLWDEPHRYSPFLGNIVEFKQSSMCPDGDTSAVALRSGDHLTITYKDPAGKTHSLIVSAQHLVLMVEHVETQSAMIFRPSVPVQFISDNSK